VGATLIIFLKITNRLRMRRAIPLLPQAFMAWAPTTITF